MPVYFISTSRIFVNKCLHACEPGHVNRPRLGNVIRTPGSTCRRMQSSAIKHCKNACTSAIMFEHCMRLSSTLQNVGILSARLHLMLYDAWASLRYIMKRLPLRCLDSCEGTLSAQLVLEGCIGVCRSIMSSCNGGAGKQSTIVHHSYIARVQLLLGALQGVPILICCVAASVPLMQHSSAMR